MITGSSQSPGVRLVHRLAQASDLRRLSLLAAACICAIAVLGLAALEVPSVEFLEVFDLNDLRLTLPALLCGGLLLGAAVLSRLYLAAAAAAPWLLALLALNETGRLQERLTVATDWSGWGFLTLLLGLLACGAMVAHVRGPERRYVVVGASVWIVAQLVAPATPEGTLRSGAGELLDIVAAAVIFLALVIVARRAAGPAPKGEPAAELRLLGLEVIRHADTRRLAIAAGVGIGLLAVMGSLDTLAVVDLVLFDVKAELSFPAWFDATLLLVAAGLVLLFAQAGERPRGSRRWLIVMSVVFALMAADELLAVHEKIGYRAGLTGGGQILLAPLLLVAFLAWLATLKQLSPLPVARLLFLGGAGAWVFSQIVDMLYFVDFEPGGVFVLEDTLEAIGTALFVFALLGAVQKTLGASPARTPAHLETPAAVVRR